MLDIPEPNKLFIELKQVQTENLFTPKLPDSPQYS